MKFIFRLSNNGLMEATGSFLSGVTDMTIPWFRFGCSVIRLVCLADMSGPL